MQKIPLVSPDRKNRKRHHSTMFIYGTDCNTNSRNVDLTSMHRSVQSVNQSPAVDHWIATLSYKIQTLPQICTQLYQSQALVQTTTGFPYFFTVTLSAATSLKSRSPLMCLDQNGRRTWGYVPNQPGRDKHCNYPLKILGVKLYLLIINDKM